MKKYDAILAAVTVLALTVMACGLQFVGTQPPPPPPPPTPVPQNINGDPGHGLDQFQQGIPENDPNQNAQAGDPNGGQILSFTADRMTINKGDCAVLHWETQGGFGTNLNGQPVERVGQQQECPQQTTVYGLGLDIGSQMLRREITITVNSGGQSQGQPPAPPTATKTKNNSGGNNNNNGSNGGGQTGIDLQATDLFVDPASLGYTLHIGVKNSSSYSGNITFSVTCAGIQYTSKSTKNSFTNLMYSANGLIYPFNANQERWTNTSIKLDKGTGFYELTCTLSSPSDTNTANNSVKKTLQINP